MFPSLASNHRTPSKIHFIWWIQYGWSDQLVSSDSCILFCHRFSKCMRSAQNVKWMTVSLIATPSHTFINSVQFWTMTRSCDNASLYKCTNVVRLSLKILFHCSYNFFLVFVIYYTLFYDWVCSVWSLKKTEYWTQMSKWRNSSFLVTYD